MKTVCPGETVTVTAGEKFLLRYRDRGASGFETEVELPGAIRRVDRSRSRSESFGGSAHVIEMLACRSAGDHEIVLSTGRQWERDRLMQSVLIRCVQGA